MKHDCATVEEEMIWREIEDFCASPFVFDGFVELPPLRDGELSLVCRDRDPAVPERARVPSYGFDVMAGDEPAGHISLRIGYTKGLYFGGNIGYGINEAWRGRGYAARACRLLLPVMEAHGMVHAFITNERDNVASRRVCEKLGARHVRLVELPEWTEMYQPDTPRYFNIFDWRWA